MLGSEGTFEQHPQVCKTFPRQKDGRRNLFDIKRLGELNCTCVVVPLVLSVFFFTVALAEPFVTDYHSYGCHWYYVLNRLDTLSNGLDTFKGPSVSSSILASLSTLYAQRLWTQSLLFQPVSLVLFIPQKNKYLAH